MKYSGAKGDEKNTSYQVYGSVRVKTDGVTKTDGGGTLTRLLLHTTPRSHTPRPD